ncbi:hypothetical protein ACE1TF_10265 [Geomicrobium sp. JSM 1781026]|uniref:hypothetical protein n=1 Tax=Geomicrobium sp. JSM 1781026 TaxID=3344580 RepID=UPI0035C16943
MEKNNDFQQLFDLMTDTRTTMITQFDLMHKKFEEIDKRFDRVEDRLDRIENEQTALTKRVGNVEVAQLDMNARMLQVEESNENVATALQAISKVLKQTL